MSDDARSITDLLQLRPKFAEIAKPASADSDDTSEDEYVAFARGRIGRRPQMMITFVKCSGEVEVLAYSRLTRIRSENPDRGFTLTFGEAEVCIEGEQLTPLFHYVREHRAVEVVEADRSVIMESEGECLVSKINSSSRE